jgi:hypothetical protein
MPPIASGLLHRGDEVEGNIRPLRRPYRTGDQGYSFNVELPVGRAEFPILLRHAVGKYQT